MNKNTKIIEELQKKLKNQVVENELLGKYTTLKIGGPAEYFFDAKTVDDFIAAIRVGRSLKLPVFILGGGTNILIGDRGIRGLVIKNSTKNISLRGAKGNNSSQVVFVEADSGVVMNQFVRYTVEEGLSGLEMHLGLPGSVGGAVSMNSKWTHPIGYVGDIVYQIKILTPENEIKDVPFQKKTDGIILSVIFELKRSTREALWKIANDSIAYRRETQPQGVHSAGCTFKNISKSSGFLIDHAGCKGMHVGDAWVSDVHANFIVNRGAATAADVVQLIDKIRSKVKSQFGVTLEEEIVRVGEF